MHKSCSEYWNSQLKQCISAIKESMNCFHPTLPCKKGLAATATRALIDEGCCSAVIRSKHWIEQFIRELNEF